jgi:hypothetical protein
MVRKGMKIGLLAAGLYLASLSSIPAATKAEDIERDSRGRIVRSNAVKDGVQREQPCGLGPDGRRPGNMMDHDAAVQRQAGSPVEYAVAKADSRQSTKCSTDEPHDGRASWNNGKLVSKS